MRLAVALPQ